MVNIYLADTNNGFPFKSRFFCLSGENQGFSEVLKNVYVLFKKYFISVREEKCVTSTHRM